MFCNWILNYNNYYLIKTKKNFEYFFQMFFVPDANGDAIKTYWVFMI